ncbi:Multidrug export protein mepA [Slackia heliotrinireducens]|uniref:Multidrug export protein MepA n=1 Tax=Slackia heliotrinireducens (strain ATCC 29202 / DSM 20476 / NCTC 11029 / RHS 1) TaxID=471855 RepID=C7N1I5_SLAHD|nr:MATE family efflux transporter [Slackia heliotrinireducens]ACV21277.1 putative efflux protein, MATE family [Slackia heliotrinireducens DSM 20476]VEG98712.1 Multidrug export protein mepA [Slackia heliotrinireducens]
MAEIEERNQMEPAAPKGAPAGRADNDKVERLGTGNIPKLVREFAIPAIVGMIVNGAYQIIDTIFLGHGAGDLGLSAITVAGPVMMLFLAAAMLFGSGGNALCALRLGEGKHGEAEHILGNTFSLSILVSIIFAILAHIPFFIEPLLTLSSATDTVRPYARTFIQIISLGAVFQVVGFGINNFIRTCGAPNRALGTLIIGAVACTVFNAIFVMGLGWGVAGSAWATVCGQAISCISVIWYFTKTPGVPLRLRKKYFPIVPSLAKEIVTLGLASFAVQVGGVVVTVVFNYVLVKYGAMDPIGADGALASIGAVQRIAGFVIMPLVGISVAIQPILGFNYGARLFRRVRTTFAVGEKWAAIMGIAMWVVLMAFAPQIMAIFGVSEELTDFAAFALRVNLITLPVIGCQIVGANYFQATGQPTKSIILSLTRQIIFLLPAMLILPEVLPSIVPFMDGLDACYAAGPFADILACFTTAIFVAIELKKLNARIAKQDAEAAA